MTRERERERERETGLSAELGESTAYATDTKIPTVDDVQKINKYVNGLISYGAGPQVEGRAATEDEILAAGEGHCGMYAYLLVKELSRNGYYKASTYGVNSSYIGESTANHSVVEVETTEGPYVFDPTYGIYYTTDMETLLSCDNAELYAVGEPSEETYYLTSRFFAEAKSLTVYIDGRDFSDLNVLNWCNGTVLSSVSVQPTSSQNIVYDEEIAPNSIVCTFEDAVEFYRFRISFMEELQDSFDLTCYAVDETGKKSALQGTTIQDRYELNYQLNDAATVSELIVELAGDTSHLVIGYFDIYQ